MPKGTKPPPPQQSSLDEMWKRKKKREERTEDEKADGMDVDQTSACQSHHKHVAN